MVHGRNGQFKTGMSSFRRTIGLEPIEWAEAVEMTGTATPYVGQALDVAFAKAQAIVAVMSRDDEARLRRHLLEDGEPDSREESYASVKTKRLV